MEDEGKAAREIIRRLGKLQSWHAPYPPPQGPRRPRLSFAAWTLYLLSENGSVKELVQADRIQIVPVPFGPCGKAKATVHMAVSDASGDSAVIE